MRNLNIILVILLIMVMCSVVALHAGLAVPEKMKNYLTVVIILIGIINLYFIYLSNQISHNMNKYEKRLPIYQAVKKFMAIVLVEGDAPDEDLRNFNINTDEAKFLFNSDVIDLIEMLNKKGIRLQYIERRLNDQNITSDEREEMAEERDNVFEWFKTQFDQTDQLFTKYLSLK